MENMKESLWQDFTAFLKQPVEIQNPQGSTAKKFKKTLTLFSWCFTLMIFLSISYGLLISKSGFEGTNLVQEFIENEDLLTTLFLAAILGPVMEELLFRLPLRRDTSYIAIALTTLTIIAIPRMFKSVPFEIFLLTTPFFALLYKQILNHPKVDSLKNKIYTNHYKILFYLLTCTFGFIHIFNYTNVNKGWIILPLLIVPQIITGLFLGYVRLSNGFKYALIFHGLYNASLLLPATVASKYATNTGLISILGIYVLAVLIYGTITLFRALPKSE